MENQDFRRPQINITRNLKSHNYYTESLDGEFKEFAFNEERAPLNKGNWHRDVFKTSLETPLDLEIGTGNGRHFQHRAIQFPDRCLVGIELKYKPLIQTIRGCLTKGAKNARICRYHAMNIDLVFAPGELSNVYIHFPDPWVSPRKPQNRFVNARVLDWLFEMQRPGSVLEFKTDSRESFLWSLEQIRNSRYKIVFETLDLHQSEKAQDNFVTQFEGIFLRRGIEINFVQLKKE